MQVKQRLVVVVVCWVMSGGMGRAAAEPPREPVRSGTAAPASGAHTAAAPASSATTATAPPSSAATVTAPTDSAVAAAKPAAGAASAAPADGVATATLAPVVKAAFAEAAHSVTAATAVQTAVSKLPLAKPSADAARHNIVAKATEAVARAVDAATGTVSASGDAARALLRLSNAHVDAQAAATATTTIAAAIKVAESSVAAATEVMTALSELAGHENDAATTGLVDLSGAALDQAMKATAAVTAMQDAVNGLLKSEEISEDTRPTTASVAGLSRSGEPEWSLIGDAGITSIDFSKPIVSFGLEYATPWRLGLVAVRKNASDNSVTANHRDRVFGQAVLAPSLANFSVLAHGELRHWSWIRCSIDCHLKNAIVNTKKSIGLYGTAEVSFAKLTESDGAMVSGYFVPLALSVGVLYRLEGQMPDGAKLGTNRLGMAAYVGGALRVISGDIESQDREEIFGTSNRSYLGMEAGVAVQIGNVLIDPRVVLLTGNDRVAGLTGAQLMINLSFILPWSVLGAATKP